MNEEDRAIMNSVLWGYRQPNWPYSLIVIATIVVGLLIITLVK